MKKKWLRLMLLAGLMLLMSGCLFRSPSDLYAQPEKSVGYEKLNKAIADIKIGLEAEFGTSVENAVIVSGDNTATIQLQDLDGDGVDEILVFAKGATEKPLQVLIFTQDEQGRVRTMETIGTNGLSFEQVEYVDFDDQPGSELHMINEMYGYGFCYEASRDKAHFDAFCDFLARCYEEKMTLGSVQQEINPALEARFRYDNIAAQLEDFIQSI